MRRSDRHRVRPALRLVLVAAVVAAISGAGAAILHSATITRNATTVAGQPHGVIAAAPSRAPATATLGTAPAPSRTPTSKPSAGRSTSKPSTSKPPATTSPEDQVLALINQARASQGVPPLTRTAGLNASASGHNHTMASGCGLSHSLIR